jgi:hypothetical protein
MESLLAYYCSLYMSSKLNRKWITKVLNLEMIALSKDTILVSPVGGLAKCCD